PRLGPSRARCSAAPLQEVLAPPTPTGDRQGRNRGCPRVGRLRLGGQPTTGHRLKTRRDRGQQPAPATLGSAMRFRLAPLVRGRPVTNHCCAATATPTRGYQSDHHRHALTSVTSRGSPLDRDPPYQLTASSRLGSGIAPAAA